MEENNNKRKNVAKECGEYKDEASLCYGSDLARKAVRGIKMDEAKRVDYEREAKGFIDECKKEGVDPLTAVARIAKEKGIDQESQCNGGYEDIFNILKAVIRLVNQENVKTVECSSEEEAQDYIIGVLNRFFSDVCHVGDDDEDEEDEEHDGGSDDCGIYNYPNRSRRCRGISVKTVYYGE